MYKIKFILILIKLCISSPIEDWIDRQLIILEKNPLKIEFDVGVQNNFETYTTPVELNILNFNVFQINFPNRKIFYSNKWSKVLDKKTNQVIIDYPDSVLINNIYSIIIDKKYKRDIECVNASEINCSINIPELNFEFEVTLEIGSNSIKHIFYSFYNTNSFISNIRFSSNLDADEAFWDPPFKNKFKIDLRK